ncbi:MAG: response regulator [Bacteroidia bacterium]|nr:response regulator [Bacteroidia bacterium]
MRRNLECIMLIEDDETVNFYNEFLLKELGLAENIVIRENGEVALEYLRECLDNDSKIPDLILLDINMPVMNGFEFLDAYESLPVSKEIKALIVMLTTSLHPSDLEKANTYASVSEYLYKPLMEEKIEGIIQKYF